MTTRGVSSSVFLLSVAAFVVALMFSATPASAQNLQVDLSSTSGLCGGQECFNADGLFAPGTTFWGTTFMDGATATNCTIIPPFTACPDSYSSTAIGLSSTTPPTLTPPSLNVPFTFGPVNTVSCGSTGTACVNDVINLTTSGTVITLPASEQFTYSTLILLGTSVNGSHSGQVTATYTDGSHVSVGQKFSDWCSFSGNQNESVAVNGRVRINADGTPNGAGCNVYAYTYALDYTKTLASITLKDVDSNPGSLFVFAMTLKPPTYTIDGGAPASSSIKAGSSTTATVTVNPQTGYSGTISLSCAVSPTITTSAAATAPSCSLSPTSVTVTLGETSPPTTTLTFTSAPPGKAMAQPSSTIFYAFWLPVPGLALVGIGFGSRTARRKGLLGLLLLGLLLTGLMAAPGCVSYTHLGNVGTPPGQYTIIVTGVDTNNLSQATNSTGTTNTVTVTVTDN